MEFSLCLLATISVCVCVAKEYKESLLGSKVQIRQRELVHVQACALKKRSIMSSYFGIPLKQGRQKWAQVVCYSNFMMLEKCGQSAALHSSKISFRSTFDELNLQ